MAFNLQVKHAESWTWKNPLQDLPSRKNDLNQKPLDQKRRKLMQRIQGVEVMEQLPNWVYFVDNSKSFVVTYSYSGKHLRMVCRLPHLFKKVGLNFIGPFQEFLFRQKKVQKNRNRPQKIRAKKGRSQVQLQVSYQFRKSLEKCVFTGRYASYWNVFLF